MEMFIALSTWAVILIGVGFMIFFGIWKVIDGSYVSNAFIGKDGDPFGDIAAEEMKKTGKKKKKKKK